jgi:flagellar biosynthesis/type III secretory pathway chaperone
MSYKQPTSKSVASQHTSLTEGFSLANEIKALEGIQCSLQGSQGCFMSNEQLKALEAKLDGLMSGSIANNASPTLLISLQAQLSDMITRAEKAEAQVKAAEAQITALEGDLDESKTALEAQKKASALAKSKLNSEKDSLMAELKALEQKRKHHQKHPSSVDPEEAKGLVANITELQAKLASVNADYKKEQTKVKALEAKVESTIAIMNAERLRKAKGVNASISKEEPPLPVEPYTFDPSKDPAILRKVLSNESLVSLTKIAEAKRESTRQYAYALLDFAQKRDPRNHVGYRDLAKLFTKKIKDTSAKKRKGFEPFLDRVRDSFVYKNAPSISQLKDEFRELWGDPILEAKTTQKVEDDSFTFWEAIKHDFAMWRHTRRTRPRALLEGWWPNFQLPKFFKMPDFSKVFWWVHPK